jgi:Ca2+:H+ antiporter
LWGVVALFYFVGEHWLADPLMPSVALMVFVLLFGSILAGAFGVVREADYLAHDLGEPYGTLILTLSIVVIEVILIASVLLGPGHNPTIGRDSIFAVMMIIINLVMGICLLTGGLRYGEQAFNVQGTSTYMAMIILLTGLGLVLPTFTSGAGGFTPYQAVFVAGITIILYAIYVTMQMRGSRRLFVQPPRGEMTLLYKHDLVQRTTARPHTGPTNRVPLVCSLMLLAMVIPIVLLAHHLARVIHYGISAMGTPVAWGVDRHYCIHARIHYRRTRGAKQ